MALRAHAMPAEEFQAARRVVLGLTLAVGGFVAVAAALIGDALVVVAVPTVALAACRVTRSRYSGYAAALVWLVFLPHVGGEALLVPLSMALGCAALSVPPERIAAWLARPPTTTETKDEAWIEEL